MKATLCLVKIQLQSVEIQPDLHFISTCGRLNDRLTFNLPDCHSDDGGGVAFSVDCSGKTEHGLWKNVVVLL